MTAEGLWYARARKHHMIEIHNHGPLITATNYWDSELAQAGKLYCSVNAGAIRVLGSVLKLR